MKGNLFGAILWQDILFVDFHINNKLINKSMEIFINWSIGFSMLQSNKWKLIHDSGITPYMR